MRQLEAALKAAGDPTRTRTLKLPETDELHAKDVLRLTRRALVRDPKILEAPDGAPRGARPHA